MTKREIIYSVFEKLKIKSDDNDISEELISSLIDVKRSLIIKQQFSKNPWHMPNEIKQELCLDLEVIPNIEGFDCAGTILSTKLALPGSIKIRGKEGPLAVRKADRTAINLNVIPVERIPFIGSNQFTAGMLYCAVDYDNKLLFISLNKKHLFLESIKVTDVWEIPEKANELSCTLDSSTDYWDQEYPLEGSMTDIVIDVIVKDLMRTYNIPEDNVNDATDENRTQAQS
jgi:hypothetical protein